MQEGKFIPTRSKQRGAVRGEVMKYGVVREYLHGDMRLSDGKVFCAYRDVGGRYEENWRTKESLEKARNKNRERSVEYRKLNPEKRKASVRNWVVRNRKRYSEISQRWIKKNPHKACEFAGRRRAREQNATLMISRDQKNILGCFYEVRERVSNCLGIPHHVDHVIPLSRGGYHIHTNLQVIPATINVRKHAKLPHKLQPV